LRARDGQAVIERAGEIEGLQEPFVDALRRVMAQYPSPAVAVLPSLPGRAVGFIGYDAAPWFEPALDGVWEKERARLGGPAGEGAFMLFAQVRAGELRTD